MISYWLCGITSTVVLYSIQMYQFLQRSRCVWNVLCKKKQKIPSSKFGGNQKNNIKHSISNIHCYKNKDISLTIITLCLCTSLRSVNPEPNGLLWVALQMKFVNNCHIYIHKLICGYITSNVCNIIFWVLCLNPAGIHWVKIAIKHSHKTWW